MNLEFKHIRKSVMRKGFVEVPGRKNHVFYSFRYNGEPTSAQIHFSHGRKRTADDGLVSSMAGECLLCNSCFEKFVSCDISKQDYTKHLKGLEGHIGHAILPPSSDRDSSLKDGRAVLCQKCISKAKSSRQWT